MSILLIGASGRTGRLVAEKLHAAAIPFRAMLRNAAKNDEFKLLGVDTVIANLEDDFSLAFEGVRTVIYAAGSSETEGAEQERLIDRDALIKSVDYAKRHGVGALAVISALLASDPEHAPKALQHYAQMKRESDDYVMDSGLDYLVLRPGELSDDPGTGTIRIVSDPDSPRAPVTRQDVAEVMVEALTIGLVNKTIGFAGGGLPILEALAAL